MGNIIGCARLSNLLCIASYEKQNKTACHYADFKITYWHFSLILKASELIRGLNWPSYRRLQLSFSRELQRVTPVASDYEEIHSIITLFSALLWEYVCFNECKHVCVIKASCGSIKWNWLLIQSNLTPRERKKHLTNKGFIYLTVWLKVKVDGKWKSPNLEGHLAIKCKLK